MMTSTLRATAASLAAIVLSMTLAAGSAALAASPKGQQPGGHLKISEVFVDFTNDAILITGEDFDFGPGPLTVTLGDPDLIAAGSIVCTPDFAASPQTIGCDFSTPGLPADGDYLLSVATGAGQSQSDEYDLTIGASGAIDLTKIVRIVETPCFSINCFAICPPGARVVGGGLDCTFPDRLRSSKPTDSGTAWRGLCISAASTPTAPSAVYAVCILP